MHTAEYADLDTSLPLLVTRAKEGDHEAWEEIVVRFTSMVDISVRKVVSNYHIAEEVRQDVFVHAFQKISTLREVAAFPQWLRIIARRMAINRMTRGQKVQSIPWIGDIGRKYDDTPETPLDILMIQERSEQLHRAIEKLKLMDRDAIGAFYLHGDTLKEIADIRNIPLGTIKRRLHVARHRLRDKLQGTFVS